MVKFSLLTTLLFFSIKTFSQSFVPDTAVNQIALSDSTSVLKIIGANSWSSLVEESECLKIVVLNKTRTEKLELIFHEGSVRNSFSEFKVSKIKDNSVSPKSLLLDSNYFESSRGLKLGMSPSSVESKLGFKLEKKQIKNSEFILHFRKELDGSVLERYNMPVFYGEYIFLDNRLTSFSFGFEGL